ncbi:exonuclease domain-containing protein [Streptomyces sulphureus]|uniref:exonuclease domain-containing protein n=1 Tax=Streptomyces sulphureus TaxID=47758 RepID=UPI00037C62B6|nr:exonuclease domain-containing protein [Streptomyces sulphureus]
MTWHRRPLAGFDLETSGVDPETDRIVTAAVVRYGGGLPNQVHTWISDADGAEIPAEATKVHGFTTAAARSAGRPAGAEAEAERHGVKSLFSSSVPMVLDPRVLDKHVDQYRPGGRRLEDLCRHYVVPLDAAHDSGADAVAACAVTWKIANRHRWMIRTPLEELHERQVYWAAEQQAGLRDYFARTPGKERRALTVRADWPLIPPMRPGVWADA